MEIDPREFRRLQDMVKENNKMLHAMRRHTMISTVFRVVYFAVAIGVAVGSYYFLQPFVEAGKENVQTIFDSIQNIRNAADGISSIGSNLEGIDISRFLPASE